MINFRMLRFSDYTLWITAGLLILFGFLLIYSATAAIQGRAHQDPLHFVKRQMLACLLALVFMGILMYLDYAHLKRLALPLYLLMIILLGLVLFLGFEAQGAQRWLTLGFLSFQPSELAKLITVIALARYLEERRKEIKSLLDLWPILILVGIPFFLIFKQPDLGTSLVLIALGLGMLLWAETRPRLLLTLFIGVGIAAPFIWNMLKDYQKLRILSFLNPGLDPLGAGYHSLQAKIAVGSGGFLGKGFLSGTQTQLQFIPQQQTDFIFSVVAEEFGLIGSVISLALFCMLIYRALKIALEAREFYGSLLAAGIAVMYAFHLFVNVGMTLGLLPVVGIPLPFLSFGGTSLVINLMAIGILQSIAMRSHKILF